MIIGGGVASAKAAVAIRAVDKEGSIALLCGEKWNPTDRPPLSKDFLTNPNMKPDDPESKAPEWYPNNNVTLVTGDRILSIDPVAQTVTSEKGQEYQFQKLLLATGASAIKPSKSFDSGAKVFTLRTVDDAIAIREAIQTSKSGICVGSGFVGLEVAASAVQNGCAMTILSQDATPWSHVASPATGKWVQEQCEQKGIRFEMGSSVVEVGWTGSRAYAVNSHNNRFEADFLVYGVGAKPNLELAALAGLEFADGAIRVNDTLQSSNPNIFAAGDCAAILEPVTGESWRTQHYVDASAQGTLAGTNMAGNMEKYQGIAYFFSDVFDIHMAVRGYPKNSKPVKRLGNQSSGTFVELSARENGELASALVICSDYNDLDPISDKIEPLIRQKVQASSISEPEIGLK